MENVSWVGVVAVMLLAMQLLSLYNSAHTASRNAHEPLNKIDERLKVLEEDVMKMNFRMDEMKRDVDNAQEKIRENEKNTEAQNKALLAILMWIRQTNQGDMKQIDDAIRLIS
jgi:peptidoglycan hydrolase CwlO-like protein